jgi:hypothetical protein
MIAILLHLADHGTNEVMRGVIFALAGLTIGLSITIGPIFLRLAVKIRHHYSVMDRPSGRLAALCVVFGTTCLGTAALLWSYRFANDHSQGDIWAIAMNGGILFGFLFLDIALSLVALYVKKQKRLLRADFVEKVPDGPTSSPGEIDA